VAWATVDYPGRNASGLIQDLLIAIAFSWLVLEPCVVWTVVSSSRCGRATHAYRLKRKAAIAVWNEGAPERKAKKEEEMTKKKKETEKKKAAALAAKNEKAKEAKRLKKEKLKAAGKGKSKKKKNKK